MVKLRLVSQNIRGLTSAKLESLKQQWDKFSVDIVLLQETHLSHTPTTIQQSLLEWECFWNHVRPKRTHGYGQRQGRVNAGTCILIRKNRMTDSAKPILIQKDSLRKSPGRFISLQLKWLGHSFSLGNAYLPNIPQDQLKFLDMLADTRRQIGSSTSLLWTGDWNFIEDQIQDTTSLLRVHNQQEQKVIATWNRLFPDLEEFHQDALRSTKRYTHSHTRGTRSRLDRFYGTTDLQEFIQRVYVLPTAAQPASLSDHAPVLLDLSPRHAPQPPTQAPPTRRSRKQVRQSFLQLEELKAAFIDTLQEELTRLLLLPDDALLQKWPQFKTTMSELANRLSRQAARSHPRAPVPALVPEWMNQNEKPGPYLSQLFSQPKNTFSPVVLRQYTGVLVSKASHCAETLNQHYARISQQPITSAEIQEELLNNLTFSDTSVFSQQEAFSPITAEEVALAIRHMRPTSPGRDGIKVTLYRVLKTWISPVLAKLFNVMLQKGTLPYAFHSGIIIPVHKGGDTTDPANYRPITLLNVDYRIFSRILKERLVAPLAELIPASQTAFLPGRSISHNIWTLQLLPSYLRYQNKWAYLAICDFAKAYDTIDRRLLLAICDKLQMHPPLQTWIRLLLTETYNQVYLQGITSAKQKFTSGIRQGCPASPLIYLLVSLLLHRHLQNQNIGIQLRTTWDLPQITEADLNQSCNPFEHTHLLRTVPRGDCEIVDLQFADDTEALLEPDDAPRFLSVMERFALGTGLWLNTSKTTLLPVGQLPATLPSQITSLKVVAQAKILGITFHQGVEPPTVDWDSKLETLSTWSRAILVSPLSKFGKATGWSAYFLSQVLYAAEHVTPPATVLTKLQSLTTSIMGNRAWAVRILSAHPKSGGLGGMALKEHLQARYLKWILEMWKQGTQQLWTNLAWNLLYAIQGSSRPAGSQLPSLLQHINDQLTFYDRTAAEIIHSRATDPWMSIHATKWTHADKPLTPFNYTVQIGTQVLTWSDQQERQERYSQWILSLDPGQAIPPVHQVLTKLWKLPIPNAMKLPYWEVVMNAILTAQRTTPREDQTPCGCGAEPRPGRYHHYLTCSPAKQIYLEIAALFDLPMDSIAMSIWTATPPLKDYHQPAWSLICILAAFAINEGRCFLYKNVNLARHTQPSSGQGRRAAKVSSTSFWNLLRTYKDNLPPAGETTLDQPVLSWTALTAQWTVQQI